MLLDAFEGKDGDDEESAAGNEEAKTVGPEGGFYDNPDVPGESEGISNAQQ